MEVYDDVISLEENCLLYNHLVYKTKYFYGETDNPNNPPTGLAIDFQITDEIIIKLNQIIIRKNSLYKNYTVNRCYVNMFLPYDRPFFHVDGNVKTCLFYFNPEVNYDEGGETQFLINEKIIGILPKPARLVIFDGNILHRATPFRTIPRITLVIKYF